VLECVVNVSEGSDAAVLDALGDAAGTCLLDRHADGAYNRAVFTLAGPTVEEAARRLASVAVERLDLRRQSGAHPRLGVVDVVPFVPLGPGGAPAAQDADLTEALEARDRFAHWAAEELGLPCFFYGPERSLPEIRRRAFSGLDPDTGPPRPHPSAGACCVGARPALVAYNLILGTDDLAVGKAVAAEVRGPELRALGLAGAGSVQVSCNLVAPWHLGPADAHRAVAEAAGRRGVVVTGAELVGLLPAAVLQAVPQERWAELDLSPERTVEARLGSRRT
jgi:glutamate formiminotransferase